MTGTDEELVSRTSARLNGLRANSFAAIVMVLVELGLGVGVNLFATLPSTDHGKAPFSAFGRAVTGGPVVLAVHAVLGTVLLITGVSAVVRAVLARRPAVIAMAGVALLGIIVAWLSGARFVADMARGASLAMAVATAVSIACYALVLFVVPARSPGGR